MSDIPFIPGSPSPAYGPLVRFLPSLRDGVIRSWLIEHIKPGSWIIDPFGNSPALIVEAARAGYRVLAAANNPISRALIEAACVPPSQAQMKSALAELAAAYKGDERLEPQIRKLYLTQCASCSKQVEAQAFLWEKNSSAPSARIYHCPYCGDEGERACTEQDLEKAARFTTGGLHGARALERVAPRGDPDRQHAEEALAVYPPRAVYVLFTLLNKLDGLQLSPARRRHLDLLLLHACDQGSSLWPHPSGRERPRQLSVPARFRENNIWLALENGTGLWEQDSAAPIEAIPVSLWPDLPSTENGVVIYQGRLKELSEIISGIAPAAVVSALPRPNQAYWTLSALWSGWLWGAGSAVPLKMVLRRRRYDWAWHTAALASAFGSLAPLLPAETPFLAVSEEAEAGLMASAVLAADSAGFSIEGMAVQADQESIQIQWRAVSLGKPDRESSKAGEKAVKAAQDFLRARGQPGDYLLVQGAALKALAESRLLQWRQEGETASADEPKPAILFNHLQNLLKESFTWRNGFIRYQGSEQSLDSGQWWIKDQQALPAPLADRVEAELVRLLNKNPGRTLFEIHHALNKSFPGLLTPDAGLILACLESYAQADPPESGLWRLRPQDEPAVRRSDLHEAREMVKRLGEKMGFTVSVPASRHTSKPGQISTSTPFTWQNQMGQAEIVFYIIASAAFGQILLDPPAQAGRQILVLPGSRANLSLYKIRSDPRLKEAVEKKWHFLKYRQLRLLEANPPEATAFLEHLSSDPLTSQQSQIRLPGFN